VERTLLIGLDGATWTVLDPYVERGIMPFLGTLVERGTRGPLRSIVPALTPPAWTSVVTGKRPGGHGVFDFFQKEEPDSIYFRFATSQDVRSATIWSQVSDAGGTVISLNFPLMFPAPPINGFSVPGGMMPWRQLRLGCHPPGLFDRLKQLPGFNPKEMLDMELEVKAIEGCPEDEQEAYVEQHILREEKWIEVARHLISEEPADLIGVMFDGVDKLQHLCWRFIDPASRPAEPTPWEQGMIERVERYFRTVDDILRELVTLAGEDATVIVVSDHGFGPTRDVFHVNTWLQRQGYLHWAEAGDEGGGDGTLVGFKDVTRHVRALDWSKTIAFAATPSSQGIHIVGKVPGTEDPLPDDVRRRLREEISAGLRELRREDGTPLVTRIDLRDEAFAGPYEAIGPDISMAFADQGTMSILPADEVLVQRPQLGGHHAEDGVFIAMGRGIPAGAEVGDVSLIDVAPLVLHRLGLGVPEDLDGRVPVEVLAEAELAAHPVRTVAAATPPVAATEAAGLELDADEQAGVMERLKALGYVE
jgi:predicted AlkP superfamily phosphohydrolase/phosphomutase